MARSPLSAAAVLVTAAALFSSGVLAAAVPSDPLLRPLTVEPRFFQRCKNIPGDSGWPSTNDWKALNKTVGGRLIAGRPAAAVCHVQPFGVFDAEECANLQTVWDRPETHFREPVEFNFPYYQNGSCDPFTPSTQPCDMGHYARYAIRVQNANDVRAGLAFAALHNIRLVVKNTGHDYLGKNTGLGSLMFWTHNLKDIKIIENYRSQDYNGPAIKLGAGVQAAEAYVAAANAGYRVLGGTCPTVGLTGGYTQGGGHSLLTSMYGMAADNVLEWEVVTPLGLHVTATPRKNADLYWALSGGGGGTFGVVLSMTTRLHPDSIVGGAQFSFDASTVGIDAFWDAVSAFHALLPSYVDTGSAMTYMLVNTSFTAYSVTAPGRNATGVTALMKPFLDDLTARGIAYNFVPRVSANFLDHFEQDFGPLPYGPFPVSQLTGSRLLPRDAVSNPAQNAAITSALRVAVHSGNFYLGCNALKPGVVSTPGNPGSITRPANSVNPAWRRAVSHCIVVGPWDYTQSRAANLEHLDELTNVITPALDAATPGSGTYLNEANFRQVDWKEQFYGASYQRLKQVKGVVDPLGLFFANTAVGSDAWTTDAAGRLCRK